MLVATVTSPRGYATTHTALSAFHTPGWAAECYVAANELGGPSPLICQTPNDGFTVAMRPGSVVLKPRYEKNAVGYRDYFAARRSLKFGERWGFRVGYVGYVYRCTSRATGLTCTNQAGHGWWLGRFRGYRIF